MAGTQNQPVEYENVSYNVSTGILICNSSSGKVGFFSTVPIGRITISSAISSTASISTSGVYGLATSTEMLQVVWAVSSMANAMKQYGLVL
jgi:hypothetical protein